MVERWLGIAVSGDKITLVDADVAGADDPIQINADFTWSLQRGARPAAYNVVHQQLSDFVRESDIDLVVVKASALSLAGTKKAHLDAAEFRGVVLCAAASATKVITLAKAAISKGFGERKADEYLVDDAFWNESVSGAPLRNGSREAALLILAARRDQ